MPMKDILAFGWRKLVADVKNVDGSLRSFATQRGMLVKDADPVTRGGLFGFIFQCIFPVLAFGFMFGSRSGHPAFALMVGAVCTAVVFALSRLVQNFFYGVEDRAQARRSFVVWLPLVVAFIAAFMLAPVLVLKLGAYLAPAYISPMTWGAAFGNAITILAADTVLGTLTGVRLFLETRDRQAAKSETK